MDDLKLLQKSNLTAWHPCRAPILLYISFNEIQEANWDAPRASVLSTTL